jgi:hypothetical protein
MGLTAMPRAGPIVAVRYDRLDAVVGPDDPILGPADLSAFDWRRLLDGRALSQAEVSAAHAWPTVTGAGALPDWNLGPGAAPWVRRRVRDLVDDVAGADVQWLEVRAHGLDEPLYALNLLRVIDCLDERRSALTRWRHDAPDPSLRGTIKHVLHVRIDPARAGGAHLFRVAGWPLPVIASDPLRSRLEAAGITGFSARRVA